MTVRMLILSAILVAGSICAWPSNAAAQTADPVREAMARLDGLVGRWAATTSTPTQEGRKTGAASTITVRRRMDGAFLESDSIIRTPSFDMRLVSIFSYDQFRQVYRVAAMDGDFGLMDIYEGRIEERGGEAVLVVDNFRSDTSFPTRSGGHLHFRLAYTLGQERRSLLVEMTTDRGATWREFSRTDFERTAAE